MNGGSCIQAQLYKYTRPRWYPGTLNAIEGAESVASGFLGICRLKAQWTGSPQPICA